MNIQDEGIIVEIDIHIPRFPYVPGLEDLKYSLYLDFEILTLPYGSMNKFIGLLPIQYLDTWKVYIYNTHADWNKLIYEHVTSNTSRNKFKFRVTYKTVPKYETRISKDRFDKFKERLGSFIEGDFIYARNFKQTGKS